MRRPDSASLAREVDPESGEGSRERILDAAERLVGERGYTAASISMICRESGLPASSVYWHFGSKEDLLAAVADRGQRRFLHAQARWSSFNGDLSTFLRTAGASAASHPDFLRLLMMLMLDGRQGNSRARQLLRTGWRGVRKRLESVMADHFGLGPGPQDTELAGRLARFAHAFIDGAFVDSQIDPDGTPIENVLSDLALALEALVAAR